MCKENLRQVSKQSLKGTVCIKTRYSSAVARPWSLNPFETFFQQAAQRQESSTHTLHGPLGLSSQLLSECGEKIWVNISRPGKNLLAAALSLWHVPRSFSGPWGWTGGKEGAEVCCVGIRMRSGTFCFPVLGCISARSLCLWWGLHLPKTHHPARTQQTFFLFPKFCRFFSLALSFWKGSQPFGEAHMSTAGRNDPCFSDYPFVVQDFLNEGEKQRVKRELFSLKWKVFSLKTTDGCKKST